jgi:uncharacterized delta-60 repeat protein
LLRLTDTGALDTSFGTNGRVQTNVAGSGDLAFALAVGADGKLVLAGRATVPGNLDDFAVVRYQSDGSVDTGFGNAGIVTIDLGAHSYDEAHGVLVQDGAVLLTGWGRGAVATGGTDTALVRLTSTGALDLNFGTGGITVTSVSSNDDFAYDLALQTDGRIVVAGGGRGGPSDVLMDTAVTRFLANGTLDSTFGTNGSVVIDYAGDYDLGKSVAIQSDGKIIVGGFGLNGVSFQFEVSRILP